MSERVNSKGSAHEAANSEPKKRPPMDISPHAGQKMQTCRDLHDED